MAFVALALSLCIAALGVLGVFSPLQLVIVVRHFQTPAGLYAAAALRLVFGVALLLAAPTSRAPAAVRLIGGISFVAGLITPFFGLERFQRLLDWWLAQGPTFIRLWAGFALMFGLLLVYAVIPSLSVVAHLGGR